MINLKTFLLGSLMLLPLMAEAQKLALIQAQPLRVLQLVSAGTNRERNVEALKKA